MRCGLRLVFLWKSEIGVSDLTKVAIKNEDIPSLGGIYHIMDAAEY